MFYISMKTFGLSFEERLRGNIDMENPEVSSYTSYTAQGDISVRV